MEWRLDLIGLGLSVLGWFCGVLTRCTALWEVSGTLDNATATLPAYWDGVWLEWDHWDLNHDGSLHCSFYQSLLSLSGSFRTWRSLVLAAVVAGGVAMVMGAVGALWFPNRHQVKVASGTVFLLSGVLLLVPIAWTCHHTSQPLGGTVRLRRNWGPALYLGWISVALMVIGGIVLATRWQKLGLHVRRAERGNPALGEDSSHPLSRINRTAFTHSQYERGASNT